MTGWKSVYALGPFPKRINELHQNESEELLAKFKRSIHENHDLTVRFKWRNENDIGESNLVWRIVGGTNDTNTIQQSGITEVPFIRRPLTTMGWVRGLGTVLSVSVRRRIWTRTPAQGLWLGEGSRGRVYTYTVTGIYSATVALILLIMQSAVPLPTALFIRHIFIAFVYHA